MAVLDATRTIAAGEWVLTPLRKTWRETLPDLLSQIETGLKGSPAPVLWDWLNLAVLDQPGWAVFAALAFLFHAVGWRKKKDGFAHIYH